MIKTDLHLKFLMIATIATLVHGVAVRADGDEVEIAPPEKIVQISVEGHTYILEEKNIAHHITGHINYKVVDESGRVGDVVFSSRITELKAFGLTAVPELLAGEKKYQAGQYNEAMKLYSAGIQKANMLSLPVLHRGILHYRMMRIADEAGAFKQALTHYMAYMNLSPPDLYEISDIKPVHLPVENRDDALEFVTQLQSREGLSRRVTRTLDEMAFALKHSDRKTIRNRNGGYVAYVIDATGSTSESLPFMIQAVKDSIRDLHGRQNRFNIYVFNGHGVNQFSSDKMDEKSAFKKASAANKGKAMRWLNERQNIIATGEANAKAAVLKAILDDPDFIFVLSDGFATKHGSAQHDDELLKSISNARYKNGYPIKINCIQFLGSETSQLMKKLAEENGGQFRQLDAKYLGIEK